MRQSYSHLLTLVFKHKYFREDLFKSIQFTLGEETSKYLNDLGLISKFFNGGLHLLASQPELLNSGQISRPIQVYLFSTDPLYINYTDLPNYTLAENLLYFNNLETKKDSNSENYNLNLEEFAGEKDIVPVSYGKVNIPELHSGKAIDFTDALGNEISKQCVMQSPQHLNEFTLVNLPSGIVRIFANKVEIKRLYFSSKSIWQKPFGIVELFPNELFRHFSEKGKVDYAVKFTNRQTIWKYFFISPVYKKFTKLSIINKGKEQAFNKLDNQQVLNKIEDLVFESKFKIPLSEFSDENYQLIDNYDPQLRSGKVVIKNLARATPEQLHFNTVTSEASAYSHIYL